jgi:hypothetical protein
MQYNAPLFMDELFQFVKPDDFLGLNFTGIQDKAMIGVPI